MALELVGGLDVALLDTTLDQVLGSGDGQIIRELAGISTNDADAD